MLKLTADPERVKHLLITARDELKARGWMQGDYGTIDGPKCTVGALAWASTGRMEPSLLRQQPAEFDAYYVLSQIVGEWAVIDWNDDTDRDEAEIIAGFDAAIGLVDAEIERRAVVLAGCGTAVTA